MAIKQSAWAKGLAQSHRPQSAGANHTTRFEYAVSGDGAIAAGDIVEIGEIHAYARVVSATLILEGAFTGTVDVGVMSGAYGSTDASRTSGAEFFDDADATEAMQSLTKPDALLLAPQALPRGIGLKFSAAQAAAAGKKITLLVVYHQ